MPRNSLVPCQWRLPSNFTSWFRTTWISSEPCSSSMKSSSLQQARSNNLEVRNQNLCAQGQIRWGKKSKNYWKRLKTQSCFCMFLSNTFTASHPSGMVAKGEDQAEPWRQKNGVSQLLTNILQNAKLWRKGQNSVKLQIPVPTHQETRCSSCLCDALSVGSWWSG